MSNDSKRIYCAGPLFNPAERREMSQIADALKNKGFSVFLPQEDGLEFRRILPLMLKESVPKKTAVKVLNWAIFSLDTFEVSNCGGLALNMNGRVPDEGAMVEAGIAWALNKPIVIFKNDDRSLIAGNCNPLVLGLSDFEYVSEYEELPTIFEKHFAELDSVEEITFSSFQKTQERGERISEYLKQRRDMKEVTQLILELFGGHTWGSIKGRKENFSQVNSQQ